MVVYVRIYLHSEHGPVTEEFLRDKVHPAWIDQVLRDTTHVLVQQDQVDAFVLTHNTCKLMNQFNDTMFTIGAFIERAHQRNEGMFPWVELLRQGLASKEERERRAAEEKERRKEERRLAEEERKLQEATAAAEREEKKKKKKK